MSRPGPLVLLLSGPNLNLLGEREPEIYGTATLDDHVATAVAEEAARHGLMVEHCSPITRASWSTPSTRARGRAAAIVINAGALTHYAWSLHDALAAFDGPVVELHLSNPGGREPWRASSVITPVATGVISGFGGAGLRPGHRGSGAPARDRVDPAPELIRPSRRPSSLRPASRAGGEADRGTLRWPCRRHGCRLPASSVCASPSLVVEEPARGLAGHQPTNIRYLTGFTGSAGLLFVLPGEVVLVTDGRYGQPGRRAARTPPVSTPGWRSPGPPSRWSGPGRSWPAAASGGWASKRPT